MRSETSHGRDHREHAWGFYGSVWASTAVAAPPTPPLAEDQRTDVAVIGAGYTGLSTALHLAERGTAVTVLEAVEPGWGASGRNGGQLVPIVKPLPSKLISTYGSELGKSIVALPCDAIDLLFDIVSRYQIDCAAVRSGWIQVTHTASRMPEAEIQAAEWGRGAIAGSKCLARRRPRRRRVPSTMSAAGVIRAGGLLHPLSYARGLAKAAQDRGARVHGATPATELIRQGGVWCVKTPTGSVTAEQIVLCTNAYTGNLWPDLKRTIVTLPSIQGATKPLLTKCAKGSFRATKRSPICGASCSTFDWARRAA